MCNNLLKTSHFKSFFTKYFDQNDHHLVLIREGNGRGLFGALRKPTKTLRIVGSSNLSSYRGFQNKMQNPEVQLTKSGDNMLYMSVL
jgi:hypothetical protein